MAIKQTLEIGDKKLIAKNREVKDFSDLKLSKLISDLIDTMRHKQLIGIAAPQIGKNYKVFITEPRETANRTAAQSDELRIYINPEITQTSKEEVLIYEGCGCMPNASIFGPVYRPKWVKVKAQNEHGEWFEFKADVILGRVIQHEFDHLQGIQFIYKVNNNAKLLSFNHYVKQIKSADWHLRNSQITTKEYKKL